MVSKGSENLYWYQKTGWILLLAIIFLVIVLLIAFGFLTINFWWQIKQGKGAELQARLSQNSAVVSSNNLQAVRDKVESTDDPILGNAESKFVIVEFVDFKCPVCKEFSTTLHMINSSFGDKVKIIVRDFPIESIHTDANKLAYFANCAGEQEKYWSAHDLLFLIQDELPESVSDEYLLGLADRLKLDKNKFSLCMQDTATFFEVMADFDAGAGSGVEGTPTFFVNGEKIEGLVPWELWKSYLEKI